MKNKTEKGPYGEDTATLKLYIVGLSPLIPNNPARILMAIQSGCVIWKGSRLIIRPTH